MQLCCKYIMTFNKCNIVAQIKCTPLYRLSDYEQKICSILNIFVRYRTSEMLVKPQIGVFTFWHRIYVFNHSTST